MEEWAAVEINRHLPGLRFGRATRALKLLDIQPVRRRAIEGHGGAGDGEVRPKQLAQVVQRLAQILVGLDVGHIAPEHMRQGRSLVYLACHRQVHQQGLDFN